MKWAIVAIVAGGLALLRLWLARRRRTISLGSRVTPRWLNEHAYDHNGDRP